ncbi:MAG: prevent-host-death protein [Thermomicrobiales bacterium]
MNSIPAQEIKQRGIGAVDSLLEKGPVHIITRNRPKYVVMDEKQYEDLLDAKHEAYRASIREALEDVKAGRVYDFESTAEMMEAIRTFEDDEA